MINGMTKTYHSSHIEHVRSVGSHEGILYTRRQR